MSQPTVLAGSRSTCGVARDLRPSQICGSGYHRRLGSNLVDSLGVTVSRALHSFSLDFWPRRIRTPWTSWSRTALPDRQGDSEGVPPPIVWPAPPLGGGPFPLETAEERNLRVVVLAKGLEQPWSIAFLPGWGPGHGSGGLVGS